MRRILRVALLASGGAFVAGTAAAQPAERGGLGAQAPIAGQHNERLDRSFLLMAGSCSSRSAPGR